MGKLLVLPFLGGGKVITIFDVAKAFLNMESMTNKKLQKLCYYAQAWHLAIRKKKLFSDDFQAWVHGPVCPSLYHIYKCFGWDYIPKETVFPEKIDAEIMDFLKDVYDSYGHLDGDQLEFLSHTESPWVNARKGLQEWEPSNNIISATSMMEFYSSKIING